MNNILINVRFFGAFRKFGHEVALTLLSGSNIRDVKSALVNKIGGDYALLVSESVLADSAHILPNAYVLGKDADLSILPPVCGG